MGSGYRDAPLLLPWHHLRPVLNARGDDIVWSKNPQEFVQLCELADLLLLLAATDDTTYRNEVHALMFRVPTTPWPSRMDFGIVQASIDEYSCLWEIFTGKYTFSKAYLRLRRRLFKKLKRRDHVPHRPQLDIRLKLLVNAAMVTCFLERLLTIVSGSDTFGSRLLWAQLSLQHVFVGCTIVTLADHDRVQEFVNACRSRGLDVGRTNEVSIQLKEDEVRDVTTVERLGDVLSQVTKLTLDLSDPPLVMASLVSAAQVSPTLKHIVAEYSQESLRSREHLMAVWRWIAYGFFSQHANRAVKTVQLDIKSISIDQVETMRTIVDAEHPLARLYKVSSCEQAFVWALTFWLMDPREANAKCHVLELTRLLRVRTIRRDDPSPGWWRILLPGKGDAWLHEEEMVDNVSISTEIRPHHGWRKHVLIASCHPVAMEAVGAFIQLLGPRVRELCVTYPHLSTRKAQPQVLWSHRYRDRLDLKSGNLYVDPPTVMGWYTTRACQASVLQLNILENDQANVYTEWLLYALCEPTQGIVGCVHTLDLRVDLRTKRTEEILAVMEAAHRMLRQNGYVHIFRLNLKVSWWMVRQLRRASMVNTLKSMNGEWVSLSFQDKIAFLSIFYETKYA